MFQTLIIISCNILNSYMYRPGYIMVIYYIELDGCECENGICVDEQCICSNGWTGDVCDEGIYIYNMGIRITFP